MADGRVVLPVGMAEGITDGSLEGPSVDHSMAKFVDKV